MDKANKFCHNVYEGNLSSVQGMLVRSLRIGWSCCCCSLCCTIAVGTVSAELRQNECERVRVDVPGTIHELEIWVYGDYQAAARERVCALRCDAMQTLTCRIESPKADVCMRAVQR